MDVHQFTARQLGISLIESLVALVVLSIGMLGVGSMILASLQDTRSSVYRTKAVALAGDMLERMRANSQAADAYVADWNTIVTSGKNCAATSTVPAPDACAPADLAAYDVARWRAALAATATGVPSGAGRISKIATVPPTWQIQVRWVDGIVNGAEEQQTVTVETML